jgi:beta-phosphoglucomutase-like phosphatase (HAD superfamily)
MRDRLGLEDPAEAIERAIVDGVVGRYRREGPPGIAGATDAVRRLAEIVPLGLASSAHREVIDAALEATGLHDTFGIVVSSDEVEHGKPEPDVYLEAARRLGVVPGRCLVVEDSFNGVRAGKAAGMTVVLVPNQTIPPAPGTAELADHVVGSITDLVPGA